MDLMRLVKAQMLNVVDRTVPVKPIQRSHEEQVLLNRESRRMHLYISHNCPAFIELRRHCQRIGLNVVEKDVGRVNCYRNELIKGGGHSMVPCLMVDENAGRNWVYSPESIYSYLENRLGVLSALPALSKQSAT